MHSEQNSILIVDDDQLILDFLESVLSPNYRVLRAASGVAAIEIFQTNEHAIALVLLDLGMPEMSGYEVLAEMQIADPDVKVIVITGMSPDEEQLPGIQAVLTKPFMAADVVSAIDKVLGG